MSSPQSHRHHHRHHHHPHHHHRTNKINENYSNERYVSILNHCFDDIETFISRLQQRKLQKRNHHKRGGHDGFLTKYAPGSCDEEFFEILSKFKLAFNLLAKLNGCIHDPNAPELVHFLFTPLAIIIQAAHENEPPMDPSLVEIPYLSPDAIEFLLNCCTSIECDLWRSLGDNWRKSVKHIRMTSPFQPIFNDGWTPAITEPELLGIIIPTLMATEIDMDQEEIITARSSSIPNKSRSPTSFDDDSDYEDQHTNGDNNPRIIAHYHHHHHQQQQHGNRPLSSPIGSIEQDDQLPSSPSLSLTMVDHNNINNNGNSNDQQTINVVQMEWLAELQSRNATKIVRVQFPRTANNNKELTVTRGEILEILDDSRKWWKARNSLGQIAYVPNTIVVEIESPMMKTMTAANKLNNTTHREDGNYHVYSEIIRRHSSSLSPTNRQRLHIEKKNSFKNNKPMEIKMKIVPSPPPPPPPLTPSPSTPPSFTIIQSPKIEINKQQQQQQQSESFVDDKISTSSSLCSTSLISLSQFSINTYDTIEQELNDRFKNPMIMGQTDKTKNHDEFMSRYNGKNENNFTGEDLSMFLTFKEFPPELINFVENLFQIKEIRCNLFHWNKNELRANIPMNIANDFLIQRLWSNLLLLKNMVKPSKMDTLAIILKQRKRLLIEKMKKDSDTAAEKSNSDTLNDKK
ncbi:uncharacterized protein LOC124490506 isoform X2 [Dermatophagoides farinae]|uniref:uncharacterized protein LOC124490506 isoform X2 n=1 Tax=Dermatophagoides farinae TaxID=6954 RepID=UPI003F610918